MFIEVQKVSEKKKNGVLEKVKIVRETIRKDEIKSTRPWHKSNEEETLIEGSMTMIYLKTNDTEMKINESYDSFNSRLGTTIIESVEV